MGSVCRISNNVSNERPIKSVLPYIYAEAVPRVLGTASVFSAAFAARPFEQVNKLVRQPTFGTMNYKMGKHKLCEVLYNCKK